MDDYDDLIGFNPNVPVVEVQPKARVKKPKPKPKPKAEQKELLPSESQAINLIRQDISKVPIPSRSSKELSRERTAKLLTSLGVDLGVKLNKNDTAEMLAYIMSANEATLEALVQSKKIPLAIKTVIKSLMSDANRGSLDTLQFLWKRVFGSSPLVEDNKQDVSVSMTETSGVQNGLPIVSRQALVVLHKVADAMSKENGNG